MLGSSGDGCNLTFTFSVQGEFHNSAHIRVQFIQFSKQDIQKLLVRNDVFDRRRIVRNRIAKGNGIAVIVGVDDSIQGKKLIAAVKRAGQAVHVTSHPAPGRAVTAFVFLHPAPIRVDVAVIVQK